MDRSGAEPIRVFESVAILMYLAEKFGVFMPAAGAARAECLSWLFWQAGSAPYVGGGFGHFYAYAPVKIEYAIDRFTMETKRQLHLLDQLLATRRYIIGDDYTIADMAILPWCGHVALGDAYNAGEFLNVTEYPHLRRWALELGERASVQRGKRVNKVWGDEREQLRERHDASDFD
jgi:GST-like protein